MTRGPRICACSSKEGNWETNYNSACLTSILRYVAGINRSCTSRGLADSPNRKPWLVWHSTCNCFRFCWHILLAHDAQIGQQIWAYTVKQSTQTEGWTHQQKTSLTKFGNTIWNHLAMPCFILHHPGLPNWEHNSWVWHLGWASLSNTMML